MTAQLSATATLRISATLAGGSAGVAALTMRATLGSAGQGPDVVHGTLAATLPKVTSDISGTVTPPAPNLVAQAWDWLAQRSITELLAIYELMRQQMIALIQDPHDVVIGTALTLPFLAMVIRAINIKRRQGP